MCKCKCKCTVTSSVKNNEVPYRERKNGTSLFNVHILLFTEKIIVPIRTEEIRKSEKQGKLFSYLLTSPISKKWKTNNGNLFSVQSINHLNCCSLIMTTSHVITKSFTFLNLEFDNRYLIKKLSKKTNVQK